MNGLDEIAALHEAYCRLTGLRIALTRARENEWGYWVPHLRRGGHADPLQALRTVIQHRRRKYRDKPAILSAVLKFSHLIGQPDLVEEDLAEAKAEGRRQNAEIDPARASALRSSGRTPHSAFPAPHSSTPTAGEIASKHFDTAAHLEQWRKDNK